MLDLIKDDFTKIADRCAEVSSELGGTNQVVDVARRQPAAHHVLFLVRF
ncbi:hypothetical protein [uncultured Corynebacterium sp.]|nr:hypothetical protein [uncultured Corynebacterium sp.]